MKIKTVYITMGNACNFQCLYCMQSSLIKCPNQPSTDLTRVKKFIEKQLISLEKIYLWGGEPLLYWDIFTELVRFIRTKSSEVNICTITNGSLLTQDKVDFLNQFQVAVGLSHDGPDTLITRKADVLKMPEIKRLFLALKRKGIACCISALNQDIYQVFDFFDNETPGVTVNLNWLIDHGHPELLTGFDFVKLHDTLDEFVERFKAGVMTGNSNGHEYSHFLKLLRTAAFAIQDPERTYHPYCSNMYSMININLQGDILVCHNSDIVIGDIDDIPAAVETFEQSYNGNNEDPVCRKCPYFLICRGGCPVQSQESKGLTCKINKMFYGKLFKALSELQQELPVIWECEV